MRTFLTRFVAILLCACGSSGPAQMPAAVADAAPASAPVSSAARPASPSEPSEPPPPGAHPDPILTAASPAGEGPPPVSLSAPEACVFSAVSWQGATDWTSLSIKPGGKPFVHVGGGASKLVIPTGAASDALLSVEAGGLRVTGLVPSSSIALRPQKPFVLAGIAIPTMYATLSYSEASSGKLTVTHASPAGLDTLGNLLSGSRPCEDLGLQTAKFDEHAAMGEIAEAKKRDVKAIYEGDTVELRREPGGKPAAKAHLKDTVLVEVFDSSGGLSRVLFAMDTVFLVGWVKKADLKAAGTLAGYGTGRGRKGLRVPQWTIEDRLRCLIDIQVFVEIDGERRTVGSIQKGTAFEVISRKDGRAQVWARSKDIYPAEGVELWTREDSLLACEVLDNP